MKVGINVVVVLGDKRTGERQVVATHNMVVNLGLNLIRDLLAGDTTDYITHIGYGHGDTVPESTNTILEDEEARYEITTPWTMSTGGAIIEHYLEAGNLGTLSEAGLFTSDTDGTMYARATFDPVTKTENKYLQTSWTLWWYDDEDWVLE
jgi:hypothetical protein